MHTGRYRGEGVDEKEMVTWKTRLRCALNKASDIQKIKDNGGENDNDPHKVFMFRKRQSK